MHRLSKEHGIHIGGLSGLRRTLTVRASVEDFETGDFDPGSVRVIPPAPDTIEPSTEEHFDTGGGVGARRRRGGEQEEE